MIECQSRSAEILLYSQDIAYYERLCVNYIVKTVNNTKFKTYQDTDRKLCQYKRKLLEYKQDICEYGYPRSNWIVSLGYLA
jgi:hypothetical protein